MADHPLLGRQHETSAIGALLDGASGGHGGTHWIIGEPGIGKTRLLEEARTLAGHRFTVLATTGYESEVDLPWAGLQALTEPLVADVGTASLPDPQRRALEAALRLAPADEPIEPFAVVLAVRHLVQRAAATRPVLLLVDDAQWLDESTRRVVDHLARRWQDSAVAMVVASRSRDGVDAAGAFSPTLLGPLPDDAASALLAQAGVASDAVRRRLVDELGGRPLLLLATAGRLSEDERRGATALHEPVPAPPSLLALAADRLAELSEDVRSALVVAAAVPGGDLATVARALAEDGRGLDALDAAEGSGLVAVDEHRVGFTHPTLRSAAYHGAPASVRRHAHRLVGLVVDDPASQALHLGQAAEGPDPELADQIEQAATTLAARGAPVEAARAHELAARLAPDAVTSAVQLRLAAELLVDTPEVGAAVALLDRADLSARPLVEQVRAERVRLRLASRQGDDDAVIDRLQVLADSIVDEDPALAASLLLEALPTLIRQSRALDVVVLAQRAREVAEGTDDRGVQLRTDVAVGGALVALGDPEGTPLLDQYAVLLDEEGSTVAGPFLAEVAAPILGFLTRTDEARALLTDLEADLRRRSALPVLATVLAAKALITHGPDLRETMAAAEESMGLAAELEQPGLLRIPASSLAVAAAMAGDSDRVDEGTAVLRELGDQVSMVAAAAADGALALGHGRLDDAIAIYGALAEQAGIGTGLLRWEPEWAEALVRSQRRAEARRVLDDLAATEAQAWASGPVARVEGMLADDDETAATFFQSSIEILSLVGNDVGTGRTELAWGERLRRARRRAAARPHLERARQLLTQSGTDIWADRAAAELVRAGGTASTGGRHASDSELTSQELQVARLAASGATNRDIGHELYVSPRTVEAHLTTVFRKLGVSNRRQLAAMAVGDERLRS